MPDAFNDSKSTTREAEAVIGALKKDFKIVGSHRVHSWYAWAIVGIVFGMALGIVYVANRSGQFDASQAALRPSSESLEQPFAIIDPTPRSHYDTNPGITIQYNSAEVRDSAQPVFFFAKASPQGRPIGAFEPLTVNQYRSQYEPGVANYVATNFDGLTEGFYTLRATIPEIPNFYSDVVIVKDPKIQLAGGGGCGCKEMKIEDLGAKGGKHGFKVIALLEDGSDAAKCGEYQKVKATIVTTRADGSTLTQHSTDQGINSFKTAEEVQMGNDGGFYPVAVKSYPYSADSAPEGAPDDFESVSQAKKIGVSKLHLKDRIEWTDWPGLGIVGQKGPAVTYDANLFSVVTPGEKCKCNTLVHVKVDTNGTVTENTLSSSCK